MTRQTVHLAANIVGLHVFTAIAVCLALNPVPCALKVAFGRATALTISQAHRVFESARYLAAYRAPSFPAIGAALEYCRAATGVPVSAAKFALSRTVANAVLMIFEGKLLICLKIRLLLRLMLIKHQ